ncbi:molybdopterin-binding protein [Saccharopolyspora sp. K220]|uniref:molybdopterin-binding protein n=1 Tax=Saccharopolyspora soli TaxID=2926618 RepID=UPI001F59253C|nr:molybdopterin-binding protein [Saccharopolyspora soli]MCI2420602.1 molybdopterin-binding protein [Saccharopolyspora soli]
MESSPLPSQAPGSRRVEIPAPRPPLRPGEVLVTGDIVQDRTVLTADLHAQAEEAVNVRYITRHVQEVHRVQGVPLHRVLAEVRLRTDDHRKKDHLSFAVVARSEDGYQVVLSWAEIAPDLGACAALLATRYNGQILTRPTLVVPHDGHANRYVRNICCLQLSRVDPESAS